MITYGYVLNPERRTRYAFGGMSERRARSNGLGKPNTLRGKEQSAPRPEMAAPWYRAHLRPSST